MTLVIVTHEVGDPATPELANFVGSSALATEAAIVALV
jgi:hypothetical protein